MSRQLWQCRRLSSAADKHSAAASFILRSSGWLALDSLSQPLSNLPLFLSVDVCGAMHLP